MSLVTYRKKRKFFKNPEPRGRVGIKGKVDGGIFVVQEHDASHLHFDFRLEKDGVLKSWAVPKGPSMDPEDKRLAVQVEDHPLDYAKFHGEIPEGNYGAGTVSIWDKGRYITKYHDEEKWEVNLEGTKLNGLFTLVKMKARPNSKYGGKNNWLLIKNRDETFTTVAKLVKDEMPHRVRPMLSTLVKEPFNKEKWIFEVKWDGYRAISEIEDGSVKLYSRNFQSYEDKFSEVFSELSKIKHNLVMDGEIVVIDKDGKPSFQALQDYPHGKFKDLVYYVFDLLYLDGVDLQKLPLLVRRGKLRSILPKKGIIRLSEAIEEKGKDFFKVAKDNNIEGIVAKNRESKYLQGIRGRDWLKIKTELRQEAVICGYTEPRKGRHKFGALILGVYEGRELKYIGHTGSGYDEKTLTDLFKRLKPLLSKDSPFANVPKTNMPVTWVKPKLVCEVKFSEWTNGGMMRQPVYLGLRTDKEPFEVNKETSLKIQEESRYFGKEVGIKNREQEVLVINGQKVKITNKNKIFWPREGYTKGDLINYYRKMAPYILPYLVDRPESLKRYPDGIEGENFFHKDVDEAPTWVKTIPIISESDDKGVNYVVCQNEATLVYLINLGCIDLNPWNSRVGKEEYPDYMIMDLDPEGIGFAQVVKTAQVIHKVMDEAGIPNYPKTSGASGIHIYSPLGAKYTYEQARQLAQIIAIKVNNRLPKITSLLRSPSEREGKVYIDCLQNARGQTLAAPYSVRPEPYASVSTPLKWSEVNAKLKPAMFTIENIPARIAKVGDLYKEVLGKGFDMKKALKKLSS